MMKVNLFDWFSWFKRQCVYIYDTDRRLQRTIDRGSRRRD